MYKILFFDIDGTLLNSNKELTNRTIKTLTAAYNKGYKIGLSSGRCIDGLKCITQELPFPLAIISLNGSYILSEEDQLIFEDYFTDNQIFNFYNLASEIGIELMFFSGSSWGTEAFNETHINEEKIVRHKGFVKSIEELIRENKIHKLLACGSDYKCLEFKERAKLLYPDFEIVPSSAQYVEINKPGINKGNAIRKVLKAYNLSLKDTIVSGDHDNDIEAFKIAGRSVAMANSSISIKAIATDFTLSNDEDGVAAFIDNYLL